MVKGIISAITNIPQNTYRIAQYTDLNKILGIDYTPYMPLTCVARRASVGIPACPDQYISSVSLGPGFPNC
jgi:hypothetical protein